ncbi:MAG: sugar transferase [Bacteroidota bacterium]
MVLKRIFDIICAVPLIVILFPFMIIISIVIIIDSRGGIFFLQNRVGKANRDFRLIKFRTMYTGSDKKGLLTVGSKDVRITKAGYFLRKTKLDELPQVFNVLAGSMSFVGPRPEVRKFVDMYDMEQLAVLKMKPGITDDASLKYFNENDVLSASSDPEKTYIETVMPDKLKINLDYVKNYSFWLDIKILFRTFIRMIGF